jgi:hypothetical protein
LKNEPVEKNLKGTLMEYPLITACIDLDALGKIFKA